MGTRASCTDFHNWHETAVWRFNVNDVCLAASHSTSAEDWLRFDGRLGKGVGIITRRGSRNGFSGAQSARQTKHAEGAREDKRHRELRELRLSCMHKKVIRTRNCAYFDRKKYGAQKAGQRAKGEAEQEQVAKEEEDTKEEDAEETARKRMNKFFTLTVERRVRLTLAEMPNTSKKND